MITRSDPARPGDAPDWPEQAVDLRTALRIFTINGAIANRVANESGSLEVGKDADFIVLDGNIFEVPITDVGETQGLLSVVDGITILTSCRRKNFVTSPRSGLARERPAKISFAGKPAPTADRSNPLTRRRCRRP